MRLPVALLTAGFAFALMAQAPAPNTNPDPQTLALTRELVTKLGGNRDQTLASVAGPMVGLMQQMGIHDPVKAHEMVDEAIMPLLRSHYDALLDNQAKSYAEALSADDVKATIAFYNTKAGQDLIAAQPKLAQARLQGMTQWIASMQPEMQAKIQEISKAHGWDKDKD